MSKRSRYLRNQSHSLIDHDLTSQISLISFAAWGGLFETEIFNNTHLQIRTTTHSLYISHCTTSIINVQVCSSPLDLAKSNRLSSVTLRWRFHRCWLLLRARYAWFDIQLWPIKWPVIVDLNLSLGSAFQSVDVISLRCAEWQNSLVSRTEWMKMMSSFFKATMPIILRILEIIISIFYLGCAPGITLIKIGNECMWITTAHDIARNNHHTVGAARKVQSGNQPTTFQPDISNHQICQAVAGMGQYWHNKWRISVME